MKKIIILFVFCLFFENLLAQPEVGNGCKVGTRRYQQPVPGESQYSGLPLYLGYGGVKYSEWDGVDNVDPQYSCFKWISGAANGCYIKNSNCTTPSCYTIGDAGYFTGASVNCPLDDDAWLCFFLIGSIGYFFLRKSYFVANCKNISGSSC